MLVRADSLSKSMSHYLRERIGTIPNIRVVPNAEVIEVQGDGHLSGINLRHHDTQTTENLPAGALFIFIGAEPQTDWLEGTLCRDGRGFLITGRNLLRDGRRPAGWSLERDPSLLETKQPGEFTLGDVAEENGRRG